MIAINVFAFIIFILILLLVATITKLDQPSQTRILKTLLLFVFLYNLYKVLFKPNSIPVEFSTVSYFIVPLIVFLHLKKIEIWAVYASLMAGSFYYITMILAGGNIYQDYPPISIYTSLYNHGTLLLFGLVKLKTVSFRPQERYVLIIGLLLMTAWPIYIRPKITRTNRIFIYEVMNATHIYTNFNNLLWIALPVYYILLTYLVLKSTKLIFTMNQKLYLPQTSPQSYNLQTN